MGGSELQKTVARYRQVPSYVLRMEWKRASDSAGGVRFVHALLAPETPARVHGIELTAATRLAAAVHLE